VENCIRRPKATGLANLPGSGRTLRRWLEIILAATDLVA
jgi:hypothetical protein